MEVRRNYVYKCEICGNIIEVLHPGKPALVCCGTPMKLLEEQTADMAVEKHVPVVERNGDVITVTVGSTLHPMVEDHYIQWIEVIAGDRVYREHLSPGQEPKASFTIPGAGDVTVREHCNKHGLWKA